jgi:hypothetical protein
LLISLLSVTVVAVVLIVLDSSGMFLVPEAPLGEA